MLRTLIASLTVLALGAPTQAFAGKCDGYVKKASYEKGDGLVTAYKNMMRCSKSEAKDAFSKFMVKAGDLETLLPLTLVAVEGEAYNPVWKMMERVPYEHRTELAEGVGATCATNPKVEGFLQGAHAALKGHDFTSWTPALVACNTEGMTAWADGVVTSPPTSPYNDKYNAVLTAVVDARGVDALPVLEKGAIAAANNGGPFKSVLDAMKGSIQPKSYRAKPSDEDKAKLLASLVNVANAVPPEPARLVADALYTNGYESEAASLLPAVYPSRAQADGTMRWAALAIETCEGEAIVHWTTWTEAPKRLDLMAAAEAPLRATKAKLKCSGDPWAVRVTKEPISDADAAKAWVEGVVAELEGQSLKVKAREEKKAVIQ